MAERKLPAIGRQKEDLFTAENTENAEMTKKERLNRIAESIIGLRDIFGLSGK